jgi:hypothetical protein
MRGDDRRGPAIPRFAGCSSASFSIMKAKVRPKAPPSAAFTPDQVTTVGRDA